MAGDKVDAGGRGPARTVEPVGAAQDAGGQVARHPRVALPEPADAIAEPVVPFVERVRIGTKLVAPRPDVPGFGDQLDARQDRVLPDRVKEPALGVEAARLAPQDRGKVEAKAVDMADLDPVAQAVHHHP